MGNEITPELYEEAKKAAKERGYVATSLFQRRLRVGYALASKLVERMEEEKFCEMFNPRRPRRLL